MLTYETAIAKAKELGVARNYTLRKKKNGHYLFMYEINRPALKVFYTWVASIVGNQTTTSFNPTNNTATLTLYYEKGKPEWVVQAELYGWTPPSRG